MPIVQCAQRRISVNSMWMRLRFIPLRFLDPSPHQFHRMKFLGNIHQYSYDKIRTDHVHEPKLFALHFRNKDKQQSEVLPA